MSTERRLSVAWLARRRALHDAYAAASGLPDASRLAHLHGPEEHFSEEEVAALWEAAVTQTPADTLNNVYVHVPFCKSICSFCNYERLRPSRPELLEQWLQRVLGSLERLAPAVAPLTFHTLYIGGGTPSVLPAAMMRRLFAALEEKLRWDRWPSRHFELDPAVISPGRLEALKEAGFSRLSFGVQTLSEEVNDAHNRGLQGRDLVARRFDELREAGFDNVACDFLLGLAGTTPERIMEEVEEALRRFRPQRIDLFFVTPTSAYLGSHFGGSEDAFWAHMAPFQERVPRLLPGIAERTGYALKEGGGHRLILQRQEPRLSGLARLWRRRGRAYYTLPNEAGPPLHVLGLGPSARSTLFGIAALQCWDPPPEGPAGRPAVYRGYQVDVRDEVRSYLVHHLRDADTLSPPQFSGVFPEPLQHYIPEALAAWSSEELGGWHLNNDRSIIRFAAADGDGLDGL